GLYAASGLLAAGGGYKPSFFTVATLIRMVDEFDSVIQLPSSNPDVWLYLFEKSGKKILAAWSVKPGAELGISLGNVQVTDSFGYVSSREVRADEKLSDFPVYYSHMNNTASLDKLAQEARTARETRKAEQLRTSKVLAYLFDF